MKKIIFFRINNSPYNKIYKDFQELSSSGYLIKKGGYWSTTIYNFDTYINNELWGRTTIDYDQWRKYLDLSNINPHLPPNKGYGSSLLIYFINRVLRMRDRTPTNLKITCESSRKEMKKVFLNWEKYYQVEVNIEPRYPNPSLIIEKKILYESDIDCMISAEHSNLYLSDKEFQILKNIIEPTRNP